MSQLNDNCPLMVANVPRIIAALYKTMLLAEDRRPQLSQYDLVKTLFLADREHLNEWGRPITYDNYKAMKHGPVPSLAYNLLKGDEKAIRDHKIEKLPWTYVAAPGGKGKKLFSPLEGQTHVLGVLSESDIEALGDALTSVLSLGFGQIRRLTHDDPAYIEAWQENGDRGAYDMKLGLLFEEPNFERAELLAEQSLYV